MQMPSPSAPVLSARSDKQNPQRSAPKNTGALALDKEIDYWVGFGYAEKHVILALKAVTLSSDRGLSGAVMQSLRDGKGIPQHHEGVWTDKDDDSLRLVDRIDPRMVPRSAEEEKQLQRRNKLCKTLEHKHGLARMEDRRRYIAMKAQGRR